MPILNWPLTLLSPAGARGRLVILTFHRVLSEPDPLLPDDPDGETFRTKMKWLAGFCNVLPLPEAVQRLRSGTLPARACCLTFDDGYANNFEVAMPILRELGLTATIFIAVDAVERGIMWNDLLIEGIRRAGRRLTGADLAALGVTLPEGAADPRTVAAVLETLKYRPLADRWQAAVSFYRTLAGEDPPRLMMTRESVRAIAGAGFDIGAHTVNHSILATQSPGDARREICASRDWVAAVIGRPPSSFAYPNGRPGKDFDDSHTQMVREAGFALAVSTAWGCATAGADPFQLPRLAPWDRTRGRYWARLALEYLRSYRH